MGENKKESSDYAMAPAIASNSDMILEITAETTSRDKASFHTPVATPPPHDNKEEQEAQTDTEEDRSSATSSRDPSPAHDNRSSSKSPTNNPDSDSESTLRKSSMSPSREVSTPTRTKSPADLTSAADDSCHPSPEVPHRTVCAAPNPLDDNGEDEQYSSLRLAGGNLGVANKGFSMDEITKDEESEGEDSGGGGDKQINADSTDVEDAGYTRQRELANSIENTLSQVTKSSSETQHSTAKSDPDLPILFFIHGVGGSADIWTSQLNYFSSKGYHVIAPDMLGHGFSSCPDKASAYKFTKLFKDFITIFDAYIPDDKKAVVIGHSYGCSFSAALARTRPEKIAALVLLASGGPTPLAPPPGLYKYPKWIMSAYRLILECKFRNQQHKYNPRQGSIVSWIFRCW